MLPFFAYHVTHNAVNSVDDIEYVGLSRPLLMALVWDQSETAIFTCAIYCLTISAGSQLRRV